MSVIRKTLSIVLLLVLLLGLTGCGTEKAPATLAELNGKTVAVEMGSVYPDMILGNPELADTHLLYTGSTAAGLALLYGGKADAYITDYVMAQSLKEKYEGITVLPQPLDQAQYGLAFRNDDPLQTAFNVILTEMKADGRLDALEKKWLGSSGEEKTLPELNTVGRTTLRVRVCPDSEPLCYEENGVLTGFEIELIFLIADELEMQVEFTKCEFSDLLPSLAAGQFDVGAAGLTVTEQRRELVDFSEPYLSADTVVIVREDTLNDSGLASMWERIRRVIYDGGNWLGLLQGLGITILLIVSSLVFGTIIAFAAYLWDYSAKRPIVHKLLWLIKQMFSFMPFSTVMLISYYIVFAGNGTHGIWSTIAALSAAFASWLYGSMYGIFGDVGKGQIEAASSMGYNHYQMLFHIFLPQKTGSIIDAISALSTDLVKCTSLACMASVMDVSAVADLIRAETFEPFIPLIMIALCYVLLDLAVSKLILKLKKCLIPARNTETEIRQRIMKGKIG